MNNKAIREYAAKKGIRLWQIANRLGITDSTFSRKLRLELAQDDQKKILDIIDDLAKECA